MSDTLTQNFSEISIDFFNLESKVVKILRKNPLIFDQKLLSRLEDEEQEIIKKWQTIILKGVSENE